MSTLCIQQISDAVGPLAGLGLGVGLDKYWIRNCSGANQPGFGEAAKLLKPSATGASEREQRRGGANPAS